MSKANIACKECNQRKGNQTAEEFGHPEVQAQAKKPLKDAAAVNTTRWAIYRRLQVREAIPSIGATGLPVEIDTGGRTKYNRIQHGFPKTHWLDAVCVGASTPETLKVEGVCPLFIVATGHGNQLICSLRSVVTS